MPWDRDTVWSSLGQAWDLVVVGGGITGAGLLWEASRQGFRALLLEGGDFASGTSSRSGKLVHGGLRYLRQGQFRVTWRAVRDRERLLREFPGLVNPLGLLLPVYQRGPVGYPLLGLGLLLYDAMALRRTHRGLGVEALRALAPRIREEGLRGGFVYQDALTDDARLVLRLLGEAVAAGASALNYARVEGFCQTRSGRVEGVVVQDLLTGRTAEVWARVVVNATGAWADILRGRLGHPPRLRPLRGSHLLFPAWRVPLALGVSFFHPRDGRPLYALPWEGVTLVGTTDVDHREGLEGEPRIHPEEGEYLLAAVQHLFPDLGLSQRDVLVTFSGVRPVVATGKKDPSREPRDHALWDEGLLTVTGGKLTTFWTMARAALARVRGRLGEPPRRARTSLGKREAEGILQLEDPWHLRLLARYGPEAAAAMIRTARPGELEAIPGTRTLWAEVRWAAEREGVVHLDDLLLRRVRLGLTLPEGGIPLLERLRPWLQPALGWDETRWQAEVERYRGVWRSAYSPSLLG
ncbi:glycerol-3-phosphate dehydrogenase/oxidase [Thermus thermamylovorans]|uniref:glycerol-3-phosphate dehydrogenase/oxidase n=1 Tax=Thermus thermamylovorans TaxID=2509362 RepID=UPI00191BE35A|nr:glycerol-3-phosphate dehydrogenase/oxidase [Thermus thermamylovorans]